MNQPRSRSQAFAIGLGCDLRHADRRVYAKGLDLKDAAAVPTEPVARSVNDRPAPSAPFPR